jgi:hypothetical protein
MRKFAEVAITVLAGTTLFALVPIGTAHAGATTYVASTGSDANTCQHADPCESMIKALSVTNPFGEIRCIDQVGISAILSNVSITQSVTIDCRGVYGQAQRTGSPGFDTGFIINGAGINVTLRGLNISGVNQGNGILGSIGVNIQQAASVLIQDCTIQGFTSGAGQGIRLATASGATNLTVIDSVIANNITGIRVLPSGGAALVSLLRVQMYDNSSAGFEATSAAGGTVFGDIADSTANGNGVNGFSALSFSGGKPVVLDIQRSHASLNAQSGIVADGLGSTITIGTSTVTANATGFARPNNGSILSYGDNRVDNNTVAGSASGSVSLR